MCILNIVIKIKKEKLFRKKIRKLQIELNSWSNRIVVLNKEQKKLLQNVLFVHNRTENALSLMIQLNTSQAIRGKTSSELMKGAMTHAKTEKVVSYLSFQKKIRIAKEFGIVKSYDIKLFNKLNDLRNDFAHFRFKNIKNDEEYYINSYELLVSVQKLIDNLVALQISETGMMPSPNIFGL